MTVVQSAINSKQNCLWPIDETTFARNWQNCRITCPKEHRTRAIKRKVKYELQNQTLMRKLLIVLREHQFWFRHDLTEGDRAFNSCSMLNRVPYTHVLRSIDTLTTMKYATKLWFKESFQLKVFHARCFRELKEASLYLGVLDIHQNRQREKWPAIESKMHNSSKTICH